MSKLLNIKEQGILPQQKWTALMEHQNQEAQDMSVE